MQIRLKADRVEIDGYVNAVERNSKPLWSAIGQFIERMCKGAFTKALQRNKDVYMLLNHDESRKLGSQSEGNLELKEDSIGLKARAVITDPDVVEKAREGRLVGWSFGFMDREVEYDIEQGLPLRKVRDLDLIEVSILDDSTSPAYDGTLVEVREDGTAKLRRNIAFEDVELVEDQEEPEPDPKDQEPDPEESGEEPEKREEPKPDDSGEKDNPEGTPEPIDYTKYHDLINELKREEI